MNKTEIKKVTEQLLARWNTFAGRDVGKWPGHCKVRPDMTAAVELNIKEGWTFEDMAGAIDNFAKILALPAGCSRWTYNKWNFIQFFSRKNMKEVGTKQWTRWAPGNFDITFWLTDKGLRERQYQKEASARRIETEQFTKQQLANNRQEIKKLSEKIGKPVEQIKIER